MSYATVAGCSHTAGVGVDQSECYVSLLAEHYNLSIVNQGVSGGSSVDVLMNIVDTVKSINKPEFIIAQWPNAIRKPIWINGERFLQNINSSDELFKILLASDEENFYAPWIQSIIISNLLCNLAQIPLINIVLDSVAKKFIDYLQKENITLHYDEKLPGRSWIFDNAANDRLHHSPACHRQWAERLIGILNELTTR